MKLCVLSLTLAIASSSCATDLTWQRMVPPTHMQHDANGCPAYTIDDAAPLTEWKKVGEFWDQDFCQGTPYQRAIFQQRMDQAREWVREKAEKGDQESIKRTRCWDGPSYMTWTASTTSDSLIQHQWDATPYACVEKNDPRLKTTASVNSRPQVAGK